MQFAKWEYRFEREPMIEEMEELLNELGAQGWEAVAVRTTDVLLKRRALDFREQVTLDQRARYFGVWGLELPEGLA